MTNAFYYREAYYLLPEELPEAERLIAAAREKPLTLRVRQLVEDHKIRSNIDKGICIAPFFYSEYPYPEKTLTVEDCTDIFPVEATLLTQTEYNRRLRETVLAYCPGCCRYKPLSNRVQSLNGHFEEIALNSVCFYRQDSKPAPRVFRELLWSYGGLTRHFDPAGRSAEDVTELIKNVLHLRYASARKEPEDPVLHVEYKPDFFTEQLTAALAEYIEKHLDFTAFRIAAPAPTVDITQKVNALLQPEKRAAFQKECKKYGVSLAFLKYDAAASEKVKRSLSEPFYHDHARLLYEEPGTLCLLLFDPCNFLKELHFRAPLLQSCGTTVEIYDQYGVRKLAVSFAMEPVNA